MAGEATNDAVSAATTALTDAVTSATAAVQSTGFALVLDKVYYFIMVPLVYLSIIFLIIAVIIRIILIFRSPPNAYRLTIFPKAKSPGLSALWDTFAMPQIREHKPVFWVFLIIYHIAFLLLILGHLDILPQIDLLSKESKHMLGAGGVGVAVTIPLFYFMIRRFKSPYREISVPSDFLLLLLIIFLCLFGDLMSWGNSWTPNGFIMTKADFAKYFEGLAGFTFTDPRAVLHGSHYHFIVLHVFLAELLFIVLPFSKIIHTFLSFPINMLRRK
jgi:nitrate reductase gamma subunit